MLPPSASLRRHVLYLHSALVKVFKGLPRLVLGRGCCNIKSRDNSGVMFLFVAHFIKQWDNIFKYSNRKLGS